MSQSAAPKYEIDLSAINIGNAVGINPAYSSDHLADGINPAYSSDHTIWPIGKVVAKTKTQLTVQVNERNKKFLIRTGNEFGATSKWHYDHLCNPAFAAWRNELSAAKRGRQALVNALTVAVQNPNKFTDDQLRAALKALGVEV